jgi:hypothetical protein
MNGSQNGVKSTSYFDTLINHYHTKMMVVLCLYQRFQSCLPWQLLRGKQSC